MTGPEPEPAPSAAQPPTNRRHGIGPRSVCAMALVVLSACGATIVGFPARPVSLRSLPNWDLAQLLPGVHDFPPGWNYSLRGSVHRTDPESTPARPSTRASAPAAAYTPRECAQVPKIAELFGGPGYAALVHVDRQTDEIARAVLMSEDEPDPNARFVIWPVTDGSAMITNYVDWLGQCGTYHVTSTDPDSGNEKRRTVATTIEARSTDAADATLAVTRSTTVTAPGPNHTMIYHLTYYWVRGVLLECATNLVGTDVDVVNRVAAQTLQKLRAR